MGTRPGFSISAASIYSTSAPEVTGSSNEDVATAASGEITDEKQDKPANPIKSILIMIGLLVGVRVLWEIAGEV